jgi:prepilin-type N-terminal cleavage/methylation domain-containing protein
MRGGRLSEIGWNGTTRRKADGFSLPELLAVLAMIAIAVAIGIPLVNEQVRIAEIRAAADDLALHLRAARMLSVTQHRKVKFKVHVDPDNYFEYEKFEDRWKQVFLPGRVRIVAGSDSLINFKQNGSVEAASSIILEATVSGARERWTASVNAVGLTTLAHERVN